VASGIDIPLVEAALGCAPPAQVASACGGVLAYQSRVDLDESNFGVCPGGRTFGGQSICFISANGGNARRRSRQSVTKTKKNGAILREKRSLSGFG
jgi:hypothetical protein